MLGKHRLGMGLFCFAIMAACGGSDSSDSKACTPNHQLSCACPGSGQGIQICNAEGSALGPCTGCSSGTGGTSDSGIFPAGGTGGSAGSGGTITGGSAGTTTGGTGGSGGSSGYSDTDCLVGSNNGSEVCDDEAWQVPSPGQPLVLVCLSANGGTTYVSSNTGPVMSDGIARCQGWETNGLNAWDYLQYIAKLECTSAQQTLDVDLSGMVGNTVWVGTHDNPAGGGHNTPVCIAWKK